MLMIGRGTVVNIKGVRQKLYKGLIFINKRRV